MNTSLAGNNILLVEKNKKTAKVMADGLIALGGNVFQAHDLRQGQELQERLDIDVVIAELSFLTGLGDLVSQDPSRWTAKSAPLVFGYGKTDPRSTNVLSTRGVLRLFAPQVTAKEIADGLRQFLFDPKEHVRAFADANTAKQISLVLQNAAGKWPLEVQQLSADGLTGQVTGSLPQGETAVLSVVFPEGEQVQRFAVRVEKVEDNENIRLKVLFKEQEHWKELLSMIEAKQSAIDTFLLLSSGR